MERFVTNNDCALILMIYLAAGIALVIAAK